MKVYRVEIKWYHLVFGLLGMLAVAFVLVWMFMGEKRIGNFGDDTTDLVE
ncbi:MAG: hypothetical protein KKA42_06460 [candidate division Zixibacteria bacterium]|nr:hypothetical protein [candidate division Zixibacteria bacterium]